MDKLTSQDQEFVKEVAITGNQTQSAKKAYGITDDKYASVKGTRLIAKDSIKAEVENVKRSIAESFDDSEIIEKHKQLLDSTVLDHMVFPLGPKTNAEKEEYIAKERDKATKKGELYGEVDFLSDEEITELLKSVNCTTRRFVHGATARHVYFWAYDNQARDKALDKVYKLKGSYAAEKSINLNIDAEITNPKAVELAKKYEEELKKSL